MEMRKRQQEAFDQVPTLRLIDADWGPPLRRSWGCDRVVPHEATPTVLVTSGTITSTARYVINERRERGEKVGLVKVKMFARS